jgi:cellulose synthase/poly-beta-1,6-N-acetylglucosamine synthase-like glycosyltransferase
MLPFLFYIIIGSIVILGSLKNFHKQPSIEPFVSIIISARNEEDSLPVCLSSLSRLNYPNDKLEIILINDGSRDRTGQIMDSFVREHAFAKIIHITEESSTTGKITGLIQGSRIAKGEYLFFTDADCTVPPDWIRSGLKSYDTKTGLTAGYLMLDRKGEPSPVLTRLQSLDWILISTVGLGWANLGLPLSIFGNNFSIRRKAYSQAGGFEAVGYHITEDFALMRNVKNKTGWKVRFFLDPKYTVFTRAEKTFREFLYQRKRWTIGCRDRGIHTLFIMSTAFLAHITVLLHLFLRNWIFGFTGFLLLLMVDFLILLKPLKCLRRLDLLKYLLLYELFYFAYTIFFAPFLIFSKKVQWKSRHVNINSTKIAYEKHEMHREIKSKEN